jgi:hypothetical protein
VCFWFEFTTDQKCNVAKIKQPKTPMIQKACII